MRMFITSEVFTTSVVFKYPRIDHKDVKAFCSNCFASLYGVFKVNNRQFCFGSPLNYLTNLTPDVN